MSDENKFLLENKDMERHKDFQNFIDSVIADIAKSLNISEEELLKMNVKEIMKLKR